MTAVTPTQEIFLAILERMVFNKCNGVQIAADLRSHTHLWRSAMPCRPTKPVFTPLQKPVTGPGPRPPLVNRIDLIVLRDLPADCINLDTLVVWNEPRRHAELERLAATWNAAELSWYGAREAFRAMGEPLVKHRDYAPDEPALLVAWWD